MSISSIVTLGFSNGSFVGSIAEVVTLGYTIGPEEEIKPTENVVRSPRTQSNIVRSPRIQSNIIKSN